MNDHRWHADDFGALNAFIRMRMGGEDGLALTEYLSNRGVCHDCFRTWVDDVGTTTLAGSLLASAGEIEATDAVAVGVLSGFLAGLAFCQIEREAEGVDT